MTFGLKMVLVTIGLIVLFLAIGTLQRPPVESIQRGYRGVGMVELYNPGRLAALENVNLPPEPSPQQAATGQLASQVYQNVQVLKDLDAGEFIRLMTDITAWVSPQQGCAYCHAEGEDLASDKLYTKVVARRMIEMTRHINTDWQKHVAETGVTCYTCHHGQPVPANVWFSDPAPRTAGGFTGSRAGQNIAAPQVGLTSLPYDPFTTLLFSDADPRVVSTTALPEGNRHSIKQTEQTYALMIHISQALGVNCTFCHNSRSFAAWDQSTPQRATTWYGIRMVRELNMNYLEGLRPQFPPARLGPLGDVPKVNCATCHQGVYKPMFGVSMLKEYPELRGNATPAPTGAPAPPGGAR
jgi:photosynthetic reaction center cytochrome c subunit